MNPIALVSGGPDFSESVKRKIGIVEALCKALRDYLCMDLDEEAQIRSAAFYKPTPETLVRAQTELEATKQQIEALNDPDSPMSLMAGFLRPQLELSLQAQEEYVSRIQKELEGQVPV